MAKVPSYLDLLLTFDEVVIMRSISVVMHTLDFIVIDDAIWSVKLFPINIDKGYHPSYDQSVGINIPPHLQTAQPNALI
ncbi:hypothetical protein PsorP6_008281 [Peronosclerospora sorghi]|uniref:Uncharacterized protein n=1 Tax=Peronosclerospora sorghi TaxID=230839 RepID=A0ACC0WAY3_9STRA|nr:hypothetical protein PsorP6_008281 [Peronosclerospora sorghi]